MKKLLLIFLIGTSSYVFSQEKDNIDWYLSTEANTSFYSMISDVKYKLSKKIYLSNWSIYSTEGILDSEGSYGLSLTMLNYKPKDFFVMSIGHRAFESYTFNEANSYVILKLTYKIL